MPSAYSEVCKHTKATCDVTVLMYCKVSVIYDDKVCSNCSIKLKCQVLTYSEVCKHKKHDLFDEEARRNDN